MWAVPQARLLVCCAFVRIPLTDNIRGPIRTYEPQPDLERTEGIHGVALG